MPDFDLNKFYSLLKKFITSSGIEQIRRRNGMVAISELMKMNEWGFRSIEELEYELRSEFEMRPCGKFIYAKMTIKEVVDKVAGMMQKQQKEKIEFKPYF